MALEKISKISGTAVHVPGDDLDTDRIVPARFLRCVTFDGLGEALFRDVRYDEQGKTQASPAERSSDERSRTFASVSYQQARVPTAKRRSGIVEHARTVSEPLKP